MIYTKKLLLYSKNKIIIATQLSVEGLMIKRKKMPKRKSEFIILIVNFNYYGFIRII